VGGGEEDTTKPSGRFGQPGPPEPEPLDPDPEDPDPDPDDPESLEPEPDPDEPEPDPEEPEPLDPESLDPDPEEPEPDPDDPEPPPWSSRVGGVVASVPLVSGVTGTDVTVGSLTRVVGAPSGRVAGGVLTSALLPGRSTTAPRPTSAATPSADAAVITAR
jgi:hypothetical protein